MHKSRNWILGLAGGLVALAIVALVTVNIVSAPSTVNAAPAAAQAAQATPAATTPASTTAKAGKPGMPDLAKIQAGLGEYNQVLGDFRKNLAGRLNISEDQLQTAVGGAMSDTLNQLVKDGKLTQSQADHLSALGAEFFKGVNFPPNANVISQVAGLVPLSMDQFKQVESDVAASLNLQPSALEDQLKAGNSLEDIARTQNIDIAKVKTAIQTSAKTQLDAAVKAGKLTQAQEDQINQHLSQYLDKLVTLKPGDFKK